MLYWVYDIPTWAFGAIMAVLFWGTTWLATIALRPFVHARLRSERRSNDLVGFTFSSFAVFYGLLLGLLAVAAYQNYSNVGDGVNSEAASLTALYHMASSFPSSTRDAMQEELRQYTEDTISRGWPLQQQGIVPSGGPQRMSVLYSTLLAVKPHDLAEQAVFSETLRELNHYDELRRVRLNNVTTGIPAVLWYVVAIGALIAILLVSLFDMELHVHLILGGIFSLFLGMMIFLIAAMDHPFRGEVSVSPDAFQSIYNSLMRPKESGGSLKN
ncbi:MAG: DUF4239 domain-containing protein [Acetobacteraceae bacterium]|nr:DUF4239 domain-containing protein [Acetobacteraceae bacterium]